MFQEYWLSHQADKIARCRYESFVRLIGGDQAKIDVRMRISRAAGVGAAEKSRNDALIRLAGGHKTIQGGLMVIK
jgi:hypothetical protein